MGGKAQVVTTGTPQPQTHISVQRYFEVSLLLTLATGFLTVATTGKLDVISMVMMFGALAIKLWSYIRGADYSLGPKTVTRISIFYIFFYGLDFLIFSSGPSAIDRMLAATVHLVLFTAVMKIFSARTNRDYGYLATISFLMMLASAVLTVGTTFLVFFTIYVLCAISTFISYEIKRSVEAAQRAPEGPFRMPEQNRRAIEKALMTAAVGLAVGIIILAAALFFVIPRYRTGYLTNLSMQAQNITGFSETVNLGDIRKILRSPMVVMRVMPEGNIRSYEGVKWRGVTLNSFNGKKWFNDNADRISVPAEGYQRFVISPPDGWEHRPHHPLRYRILRAALSTDVLFAAAEPRELSGVRLLNVDETGSLHNPRERQRALRLRRCFRHRPASGEGVAHRAGTVSGRDSPGLSPPTAHHRSARQRTGPHALPLPPPIITTAPPPSSPTCATISNTHSTRPPSSRKTPWGAFCSAPSPATASISPRPWR